MAPKIPANAAKDRRAGKNHTLGISSTLPLSSASTAPYKHHRGRPQRKTVGEPIQGYYPAVVPTDLFYAVQEQFESNSSRQGNGGGRTGKINNLFGYIAKCGECGSPMAFHTTGAPPRGKQYLVCDGARRNLQGKCSTRRLTRYDEFEEMILTHCRNLNPGDLLPGKEEQESATKALQGRATALQGEMKGAAAKVSNLTDSIATTENSAVRRILEDRLAEMLNEQEELNMRLARWRWNYPSTCAAKRTLPPGLNPCGN